MVLYPRSNSLHMCYLSLLVGNCGEFTYRTNVHAPAHSGGQKTLAKIRQTTQRAQLAPPAVMPFLWKKLFFSMVRHAWWLNVALVHFTNMALKFQLSKAAGLYHPNRPRNQLLRPFNSTTGTRRFEACGAEYLPLPFVDRSETLLIVVQQGNKYETLSTELGCVLGT